ncbi:hypothetical protein J6V85_04345 [Candidatus Saccharibacteria bacterium]|nr:hypothetical protein [Candidatus Saccharibacteria bacterium]
MLLALSVLLTMLVACGDDSSSSSVSPDPRPCEDQNEDCDDTSSSSGEVAKNSSSSQKNSNKDKSSSSVEKSKSSSSEGKQAASSSSSKKDEKSSSSTEKAKESSSSVKPSSSDAKSSSSEEVYSSANSSSSGVFDINAPCTYGDVYIEEVDGEKKAYICYEDGWKRYIPKSSSSSVAKSSSSSSIRGYEALPNVPFKSSLSYGEFTDTRDGIKYATIDIDNKYGPDSVHLTFTVFAQNLKYHDKMVLGAEEQDDDTKVEMYCYNDSIEYCNDWWGGLYQWAEMMALPYECNNKSCADLIDPDGDGFHQGICPDGWHVMTLKEMLAASYTTGGDTYLETRMSTIASEISYSNGFGNNASGMSFLAAGYRDSKNKSFAYLRESAVIDYAEECPSNELSGMAGGVSKAMSLKLTNLKINGASVRCVKDY